MRPVLLLFAIGCAHRRGADAGPLPSADELFARNLAAIGGPSALQHENFVAHGTLTLPGQKMSGAMEVRTLCAGENRTISEIAGVGKMETGVYRGVAWSTDQIMGPRLQEEKQSIQTRRAMDCHMHERWATDYPTRQTVGKEDYEGVPTYKVEATGVEGLEHTFWFDAATGHIKAQRDQMATEMGKMPVTSVYEDFRATGGLTQPMRVTQKMGPMKMVIELQSIEFDLPTPPDVAPPAEVLPLLGAQP